MILDVVHSQERAQLDGLNQFDGALHGRTQPSGKGGGGGGRILIIGDLNYNIKCMLFPFCSAMLCMLLFRIINMHWG